MPESIAAVRALLSKGNAEWTVAEVAGAFKGAIKAAGGEVLDRLAELGRDRLPIPHRLPLETHPPRRQIGRARFPL